MVITKLFRAFLIGAPLLSPLTDSIAAVKWKPESDSRTSYSLLGPAFSYHQQRTHGKRPYNEQHSGLGIRQRTGYSPWPGWDHSLSLSLTNDSFYKPALFATGTLERAFIVSDTARVSAGLSGGVAYKNTSWEGPRKLVPYLGPALSLAHAPSGLGLSLLYCYHRNATNGNVNGVVTLQLSYKL